jgi:putative ABC transport system ATP-binding protein
MIGRSSDSDGREPSDARAERRRVPRSKPLIGAEADRGPDGRRRPSHVSKEPLVGRARPPAIQIHRLSKTYELGEISVRALRDVSLQIDRGDLVAIMGTSGSGKSTLMNIVGCLDVPSSGEYLIDGVDVSTLDEDDLADLRSRKIGFVFQSFNLVARTSAIANVELPLAYAGVDRTTRRQRARRALEAVGMGARLEHQPSELSGGQQQRAAVARAIVTNPTLILADEPTGNLDSHSTDDVLRIFARLNEEGRTVVLITHESEVAAKAKRTIRLSDGQIVEDTRSCGVHDPPPAIAAHAEQPENAAAPELERSSSTVGVPGKTETRS